MNRSAMLLLAALACGGLQAQTNPLIAEMKASYNSVKNNLIKAAEKIPDDMYSWKPVDTVATVAARINHIANQYRACGNISGQQATVDTGKTDKASVVAALKASFDACDKAWDAMNDQTAVEMIAGRGGQRSKLGTLIGTTVVHNNEMYGYLSVYMRMKNIVPPSSDRGPM